MNSYVPVNLLEGQGEITTDMIKNFQVVVLTNTTLSKQIEVDEYCHNNGIAFIAADVRGLFGLVTSLSKLTRLELIPIFVCTPVTLLTISVPSSPAWTQQERTR